MRPAATAEAGFPSAKGARLFLCQKADRHTTGRASYDVEVARPPPEEPEMPTTLTLHTDDIALLIAGIVSLVILAAIWGSVATTAAATRTRPMFAGLKAPFKRAVAWYRRRSYTGRHWVTA